MFFSCRLTLAGTDSALSPQRAKEIEANDLPLLIHGRVCDFTVIYCKE